MPVSNAIIHPWPEWLPLARAAEYACMGPDKLQGLVEAGEVFGYRNPDFRRGPKGTGEWWIDRASIDAYHERRSGRAAVKAAALAHQEATRV